VVGNMAKGSQAGVKEPEALGDVVLCNGPIDRAGKTPSYCEYRVKIPRKANWTLWARVRYPTGGDMSFGLVLPGEEVTLDGRQVIGNCGANDKKWHWTGRGGGVSTVPPGSPIVFPLEPGEFVFRIYPREGGGTAATNPRQETSRTAERRPRWADNRHASLCSVRYSPRGAISSREPVNAAKAPCNPSHSHLHLSQDSMCSLNGCRSGSGSTPSTISRNLALASSQFICPPPMFVSARSSLEVQILSPSPSLHRQQAGRSRTCYSTCGRSFAVILFRA